MTDFIVRLKQRKLVQWAIAYVAFAFALIQGVDVVAQQFGWPEEVRRGITLTLVLGFFVVLVLAWYHGERGVQRVTGTELLIITLLLAVGGGVLWRYARVPVVAAAGNSSVDTAHSMAPVGQAVVAASAATAATSAAAPTIPAKSIAVLPLANDSGDKDQQYFSDGLSEDFINALSQFAGLKVIGRNSAFQFRDTKDDAQAVGAKLGVAHLLEGSVRREGETVRISAELINTKDASTLWSQHYDRPYKDLFKLQDDITQAVASALQAKLLDSGSAVAQSDRPPSGNLAAYNAYLRGVADADLRTEGGMRNAITQFDEAIRLDPRYALAYAAASNAWQALAATFDTGVADQRHDIAQGRSAVDRALQLNPDLAAAHAALSGLMVAFDFNWQGALAESQRAADLAPGTAAAKSGLASIQARLGHLTTAIELDRQALASAPLSAGGYFGLGRKLSGLGQLDEAEAALRKSIELAPGASRPYAYLAIIEVQRGDAAAALAAAKKTPPGLWHDFAVALALQIGANRAAADAALNDFVDKAAGNAYQIADVYAVRRDPYNLFKWLDRAWANDDAGVELLLFDPLMLRYRHDPRFAAFCKKVGLPTTTDAKAMP
jgi:TolB-like protein